MEMKDHDIVEHKKKDLKKINDDKSVEESESTENESAKESNIDCNIKSKKIKIRNVRKTNRIIKTISEEGKKIIIDYMEDWIKRERQPSNPFKELAKRLKNSCGYDYDSKAICDYYWHILDPQLDRSSFSPEEKKYICELVEEYLRTNNGSIQWKNLQPKVEEKFGNLRSRNSLKNVWNSYIRRNNRLDKGKREIERKDDIKLKGEIEGKNKIEGVPETKQEKHTLRYLLNYEDENDKNNIMDLD